MAKHDHDKSASTEPLFIEDRKPDRLELTIRAICGGAFGSFLASAIWLRLFNAQAPDLFIALLYIALSGFGAYFAATRGDVYWERLANVLRWPL